MPADTQRVVGIKVPEKEVIVAKKDEGEVKGKFVEDTSGRVQ